MSAAVTWSLKDGRCVARTAGGAAVGIAYRHKPGTWSMEKAVAWPGGARDWIAIGTAKTLGEAKSRIEKALRE